MKNKTINVLIALLMTICLNGYSQQQQSMYGNSVKVDVKMKYVYSFEEALKLSKTENKPIFFNCFADWAVPCHGMNDAVFSNQDFADYMDKHFVNLFIDVTTPEGKPLAEKYQINKFAQYLVLDSQGNILLRIIGGKKLPAFKDILVRSLSAKTSLLGTKEKFESGKYSKKDLLEYLYNLDLAGETEQYLRVSKIYLGMIGKKDYAKAENWKIITKSIDDRNSDLYNFLIEHKKDFVSNNGAAQVNNFISQIFINELYGYASGNTVCDESKLLDIFTALQKADLPDDSDCYLLYDIAKLRTEKKYSQLVDYMQNKGKGLDRSIRSSLNFSFNFEGLAGEEKTKLVNYLIEESKQGKGKGAVMLKELAQKLDSHAGIEFKSLSYSDALKQIATDNKLLFIDCYTTWCGPCKMMANQVFIQPNVGSYFKDHFISLKMDMEKGEGVELAKKFAISAFPTMLIINKEGQIIARIVGYRDAPAFLKTISALTNTDNGYMASKEAYSKGQVTPMILKDYANAMRLSGEMDDAKIQTLVSEYCAKMTDERFCKPENWALLNAEANDVNSPLFARLLKSYDKLAAANGAPAVNKKIEKVTFPYLLQYFKGNISEQEAMKVIKDIQKVNLPTDYTINILGELIPLFHKNKTDEVLNIYEKRVATLSNPVDRLNIDELLYLFLDNATQVQLDRAGTYVGKALQVCDNRAHNGYMELLGVLKKMAQHE
jgi:thiol-disulfide isomerase/thioredoxin